MKGTKQDNQIVRKKICEIRNRMKNEYSPAKIQECAEEILKIFQVDLTGCVLIVELLNSLGIKTYQRPMEPRTLSAYISIDPKYVEIYGTSKIACVNSLDNVGHRRFALAHELAHYIFDYDETESLTYYNTYKSDLIEEDDKERRANFFAANFLMPEKEFIERLNIISEKYENSKPDTIEALAKHFQVSVSAILKRLEELQIKEYM